MAPLRLVSVWLALAVALLSSLMSEGLPRSTAVGSAFNPATTAVALQPNRTQPRLLVDQLRRDDDRANGQGSEISLLSLTVQPASRPVAAVESPKPAAAARRIALGVGLDGTPRGPPLT